MTFTIEFARLAEKDLEKSFRWYLKYSQKIALQFVDLVEQQVDVIAKDPIR